MDSTPTKHLLKCATYFNPPWSSCMKSLLLLLAWRQHMDSKVKIKRLSVVVVMSSSVSYLFSEYSFKYLLRMWGWANRKKQQKKHIHFDGPLIQGRFLTPPQKTYSVITVTQLDMAIPVKMWQRDSLSLPSPPLLFTLSLRWLFQGRIMHWESDFFSLVFFHFACENVSFLNGHRGKKDKKQRQQTET